jgi:hypothetical protein
MRNIIHTVFLLLAISSHAQSPELLKTVDSINLVLKANPLAYYTDHNKKSAFIRQISVSAEGMVRFTDSIPKDDHKTQSQSLLPECCPPKTIRTLDLSMVKKWDIYFPIAYLKDKNNETYGRIIGIRQEDLLHIKAQFEKLAVLCRKKD